MRFVKETRFGDWFIGTEMWKVRVLARALEDLKRMLPGDRKQFDTILDVGCGFGHSFERLHRSFKPTRIIGIDADPDVMERADETAKLCSAPVELIHTGAHDMHQVGDETVDMVFCHQSFHHIVEQEEAMAEFYRILKPGGVLLMAESTKRYIESLQIRLLFRHPMDVQKTAEGYIDVVRAGGFELPDTQVSLPFLWWSRPDCGFLEWIGVPVPKEREETLVNVVAVKPL